VFDPFFAELNNKLRISPMHELSIALSLVEAITETLIRENARGAKAVTVEIGELSGVTPDALRSAFLVATRGTELAGCELRIVEIATVIWCDTCRAERPAPAANNLTCPHCRHPAARIVHGKELDIVKIELAGE
jgi:hydrogenase nickel incorporation protein HypA/HybF